MATFSKMMQDFNLQDMLQWLVKSKTGRIGGLSMLLLVLIVVQMRGNRNGRVKGNAPKKVKGAGQGNVDSIFMKRVWSLFKICIPSLADKIVLDFMLLNVALVFRTVMSINISAINGTIVKSIIQAKFPEFIGNITKLAMYAVPASFINSYLDYLNKKIALRLRSRLTYYFHDSYIKGKFFYQVTNVDARIPNPDQRLTEDVDKWANAVTNLYSNFSKPLLDIILFSKKLSELMGWSGPGALILWYIGSAFLMKVISPAFGVLYASQQKLEGEFRASHANLHQHSEEIAFYRGGQWEQDRMNQLYMKLYKHGSFVATQKLFMGVFDSILVKYGATMVAYGALGIPVFGKNKEEYIKAVGNDTSTITRDYIRNSALFISLAKAIGRIVISYKEVQELAGYTTLVHEIKEVIDDLKAGSYARFIVDETKKEDKIQVKNLSSEHLNPLVNGKVSVGNMIKFHEVPLKAPNGDLLANNMGFWIKSGMNCLFIGPNGSGKTSLYRILAQLWPLSGGELTVPPENKVFYLTQRAYLPKGTLRDQMIYPDTESKLNDKELLEILDKVKLRHLYDREGGFDKINEWMDILSGGERQRISFSRILYHKPEFAVLDECTSAVSMDFEHVLYTECKKLGITMFTISQRSSLYIFHDYILKFDGDKDWTFEEIIHDEKEEENQVEKGITAN